MPPLCCRSNPDGSADCWKVRSCVDCPEGDEYSCNPEAFECFVRNVLTRALGELILEIGVPTTRGVIAAIPEKLLDGLRGSEKFEDEPRPIAGGGPAAYELDTSRRSAIAYGAAERILELACTYQAQVEFRNKVLQSTPRGKEIVHLYDDNLGAVWAVARDRYDLMERCRSAWLKHHPFVERMVRLSESGDEQSVGDKPSNETLCFSIEDYTEIRDIAAEFSDSTTDERLRSAIAEMAAEMEEYAGLGPRDALAKIRNARCKASDGSADRDLREK